ncbi:MAG TPA: prolyl oligopeptidase family serine peptidase [Terriglobales bacterium]|nr:prolyl oligopeptidase family serine peptidase [Terriglobales bacterium]
MKRTLALFTLILSTLPLYSQKPKLTLDQFFNYVEFENVAISPDGHAVVFGTTRADWAAQRFRRDLWLYRDGAGLIQLTQSGQDSGAQWSPDGKWIAFLSDRKIPLEASTSDTEKKDVTQLYVISSSGGEAFPVTRGEEGVHAFAWLPDSRTLVFATREPWSKDKREAYKTEWKDTIQYREQLRGDVLARLDLDTALNAQLATPTEENVTPATEPKQEKEKQKPAEPETAETPGASVIASTPYEVAQIAASPTGSRLAFRTTAPSHRQEGVLDYEIFLLDVPNPGNSSAPVQLTHNQALEDALRWSPDGHRLFFAVSGDFYGAYEELQKRVYSIDVESRQAERWAPKFPGAIESYSVDANGSLVAPSRIGTQVQMYTETAPTAAFDEHRGWPGTYENISAAKNGSRIAFVYSSLTRPAEVYIADSVAGLENAKPISAFNRQFAASDLPQGKTYRWKSDDGTTVEGMLIFPPGKFDAKNLPMLTLIHGGPEDADGDHFEADWYQWSALAATNGWLIFQPNYRGSTGYGDKFLTDIRPHIVSVPGHDILTGVDALVKDGYADPARLTVGGYSYGGYMTNWLITQTTRFKAAVTGAGAVEHTANWGNDDLTYDDAWYLGGAPWEAEQNYNAEAAIWQINKVKTPTHIVVGEKDIRVAAAEGYLLERALHTLHVPSTLLVFPGEGHPLDVNPWHGRIKVREELRWLEKYGLR